MIWITVSRDSSSKDANTECASAKNFMRTRDRENADWPLKTIIWYNIAMRENRQLTKAKSAKNDEFYTQYNDVQQIRRN